MIAVPPKLTQDAIKPGTPNYSIKQAYFINSTLASTTGGYLQGSELGLMGIYELRKD